MQTLATLELHPGAPPTASLIVLHGLGADGADLLPLADEIDLPDPVRWVLPRAPIRAVTINGGQEMRAWYDIVSTDLARREDASGVRASVAAVHALLDREVARGIPAHRIVLAGFSQGCAITLAAGLRYPQRLAGLVGLSGYLPLADETASARSAANADVPVFLAHGTHDPVVPLARGHAAREALVALGHRVAWHAYPMQHSLCLDEVQALGDWLRAVLT
ncbi:MAG: dienelactone hydrolase family protein [Polyangiales bacterium]